MFPAGVAQWESTAFTRQGSVVQSHPPVSDRPCTFGCKVFFLEKSLSILDGISLTSHERHRESRYESTYACPIKGMQITTRIKCRYRNIIFYFIIARLNKKAGRYTTGSYVPPKGTQYWFCFRYASRAFSTNWLKLMPISSAQAWLRSKMEGLTSR